MHFSHRVNGFPVPTNENIYVLEGEIMLKGCEHGLKEIITKGFININSSKIVLLR